MPMTLRHVSHTKEFIMVRTFALLSIETYYMRLWKLTVFVCRSCLCSTASAKRGPVRVQRSTCQLFLMVLAPQPSNPSARRPHSGKVALQRVLVHCALISISLKLNNTARCNATSRAKHASKHHSNEHGYQQQAVQLNPRTHSIAICKATSDCVINKSSSWMRYPNVTWRIILPIYLFTTELRHTCIVALYFSK